MALALSSMNSKLFNRESSRAGLGLGHVGRQLKCCLWHLRKCCLLRYVPKCCLLTRETSHMDRCKTKLDRHFCTCVMCVCMCRRTQLASMKKMQNQSMQPSACSITRFTVNCDNGGGDMQIKVSCKVRASQIDVM